ncbi:MAG TPA: hypothetical protein VLI41_06865 [Phenylobacterium sp.]|uniref:hypothetical protein n=1 Tax=Phenylobacterium sp. TaxID=1871053 RepID=UPI002BFEFE76|nr:hypothetical protein [Phenylobacterium sp.]HSV02912.1 hypothetical protein [Phenylobacterium sp.]
MRKISLLIGLVALVSAGAASAGGYRAPRNAWGQPDLGGTWNSDFALPLEATPGVPLVLSEAQAKAFARQVAEEVKTYASLKIDGEVRDVADHDAQGAGAIVKGERRSRQVVQPADGIIPMTPRARGQVRFVENVLRNSSEPPIPADGPEQRPDWERCIVGQGQPPVVITNDINPRLIVQTKAAVVILTEYGPDLRIIPFAEQHGPAVLAGPLGDSIARWEGETLVIETVGLPARDAIRPLPTLLVPASATVEERYTRVSATELLYQYTVKDPSVYAGPWLAEYSLYRTDKPLYEFACHEGNYALPDILAGARAQERAAAAK